MKRSGGARHCSHRRMAGEHCLPLRQIFDPETRVEGRDLADVIEVGFRTDSEVDAGLFGHRLLAAALLAGLLVGGDHLSPVVGLHLLEVDRSGTASADHATATGGSHVAHPL